MEYKAYYDTVFGADGKRVCDAKKFDEHCRNTSQLTRTAAAGKAHIGRAEFEMMYTNPMFKNACGHAREHLSAAKLLVVPARLEALQAEHSYQLGGLDDADATYEADKAEMLRRHAAERAAAAGEGGATLAVQPAGARGTVARNTFVEQDKKQRAERRSRAAAARKRTEELDRERDAVEAARKVAAAAAAEQQVRSHVSTRRSPMPQHKLPTRNF